MLKLQLIVENKLKKQKKRDYWCIIQSKKIKVKKIFNKVINIFINNINNINFKL